MLAEASSRGPLRFFKKNPLELGRSLGVCRTVRTRGDVGNWQLVPSWQLFHALVGLKLFHTSIPPSQSFTVSPHQEKQFHIGTQAVSHRNPTAGRVRSLCLRANLCEVYRPFCAKSWCSGHFTVFSFLMHRLVYAKSRCTGQ